MIDHEIVCPECGVDAECDDEGFCVVCGSMTRLELVEDEQ